MKRRLFSALLLVVLLLVLAPISVSAEEGPSTNTSGAAGPSARYYFNPNTGNLRITGTGEIYSVRSMEYDFESAPWAPHWEQIKSITIGAGITHIGDGAFRGLTNLTTVDIADSVKEIGHDAFLFCRNLTNVDFPTSLTYIGFDAFRGCEALTEVILPEGLIYLSENAFSSCYSITRAELPSTLEVLGSDAFWACYGLTSITIPRSVYQMEGVFGSCENLKDVTIHSDTVSIMERDFSSCEKLEYIHILGDAPVNDDMKLFGDSLLMPVNFRVYYDEGTSGWNPPRWNSYEIMIWGQPDPIRTGSCGPNVTWTLDDGLLTISGTGPMTDYSFTNAYEEGVSPEYGFFQRKIKEVVIEEGITRIGTYAFSNSSHLTYVNYADMASVTIPSSVTHIGANAFENSYSLKNVNLAEGLVEIGNMAFRDCPALETINLPSTVTTIDDWAFSQCSSLVNINLHDGISYIGEYAFDTCLEGQHIAIPAAMTVIPGTAFGGSRISGVDIHDGVTRIEHSAFYGCSQLEAVTIPESVTYIGGSAFASCEILESVTFLGDAPAFEQTTFMNTATTAYYPENNETWTDEVMQEYGGTVTWVPYHNHEYSENQPAHGQDKTHSWTCILCGEVSVEECTFGESTVIQEATLTTPGITTYTCTVCGGSYNEEFFCRIFGNNRYETAYSAADMLKSQLGVESFSTIIVASGLDFADALTGSYLAAVKQAPILLVNQHFMDETAAYINENLAAGGKVYLLGGEVAVSPEMEAMLPGIDVERLAGANRLETNLKILEEAGVGDEEILVCYSHGFADSLSASAVGKPILMVNRGLTPAQKEFLATSSGKFVIIGGVSAVSEAIEAQLQEFGTTERIGGANRYETSINVAKRFFENPQTVVLAYGANFPDGLCGGPLAYSVGAPLILTRDVNAPLADAYTDAYGITYGAVLGGPTLISDDAVNSILD